MNNLYCVFRIIEMNFFENMMMLERTTVYDSCRLSSQFPSI